MQLLSFRSILTLLLTMTLLFCLFPVTALAADSFSEGESGPSEANAAESDPSASKSDPPVSEFPEPESSTVEPSEAESSAPESSEAESSTPESSEAESSVPESSEAESSVPESSEAESSTPESSEAESSVPESSEAESSTPESSEAESSVPESSEAESSAPESSLSVPSESSTTVPAETSPLEFTAMSEELHTGPGLYFGQLHAHSSLSGGTGTPAELFTCAAQTENLDFFALTDHSHSLDHQDIASIGTDACEYSADWTAGKEAAQAVTGANFVGIFGYEMSWPTQMNIGHISTFGTPGFQSWKQEPYNQYSGALTSYYQALAAVPGSVSQFNHPGTRYGSFSEFDYSETGDQTVSLLEIGSDGQDGYDYYIQALDAGWHIAPANNQTNYLYPGSALPAARTVVYAQALTEAALLAAMADCRVYATEDCDLEIYYSMDGYAMGSRLDLRQVGQRADLCVTVSDPSDAAIGTLEVITAGGVSTAKQTISASSGTVSFSLSPNSGYYFLKITQPDGDVAITAPIWIDSEEALGISGLACDTPVPVCGEDIALTLNLYNQEPVDFLIESLTVFADGVPVFSDSLTHISANTTLTHSLVFSCDSAGITRLTVRLLGSLEGAPRSYEASVTVSFHQVQAVTGVAVDGSHGNAGLNQLTQLRQMALENHINFTLFQEEPSLSTLLQCRLLLIPAPSTPFSEDFVNTVRDYVRQGGSVILCGQADTMESGLHSAVQLNRLLQSIGSTMVIHDDALVDTVNNGGDSNSLFPDQINRLNAWCSSISQDQVYRAAGSCSISPGSGQWLVKCHATTDGSSVSPPVVLAWESLSGGGTVFAAGSLFLDDSSLEELKNKWDHPYANRTLAQALLGIGGDPVPIVSISQVRDAAIGSLVRIQGYATSGTSNPYNTFSEGIYLQDDTGGILLTPLPNSSIQTGTPLEITGTVGTLGGNRIVRVSSGQILTLPMYQYQPRHGSWDTLLQPAVFGGSLVEVEGTCLEIYCREDDTLAGCLLEDAHGSQAKVQIEDNIFAGSDGKNDLHLDIRKGRTVRAMGVLYTNEYGETVIRVRNCEEVVYVPPRTYINPRTGDFLLPGAVTTASMSLSVYLLLKRHRFPFDRKNNTGK